MSVDDIVGAHGIELARHLWPGRIVASQVRALLSVRQAPSPARHGRRTPGWRWLRVIGPLDLSEIGILASIATPLARAEIPIFVVSSFETDHLLIRAPRLEAARRALEDAGWTTEDAAPRQDVE